MLSTLNTTWPVLRSYDQQHLGQIALPLGGIGTGTVSLGGRGHLQDWEIVNRPAKGSTGAQAFFALHVRGEGQEGVTRVLEGVLAPPYEGAFGATALYHGLPRFRGCSFHAAYPLAQVCLDDPAVPVAVRLEAFNPFVPTDAEASGLPVAVLRYVLRNTTDRPLLATVCGSIKNTLGSGGAVATPLTALKGNRNELRAGAGLSGLFLSAPQLDANAETWGTLALAALTPEGAALLRLSHKTQWSPQYGNWRVPMLRFWDDLSADGNLDAEDYAQDTPMGSLAAQVELPAHGERAVTFLLAWHFPNRETWTPPKEGAACACGSCGCSPTRVGNHYTTQYADAWAAAEHAAARLGELEGETVRFVQDFCASDLPAVAKEAALFNLSTLRSPTCFRTADGRFYGWEGCGDSAGCCYGSCTHVWNYEQSTPFLFGALSARMREVEFAHATRADGHMSFRVNLPLPRAHEFGIAAADGQMGCILKMYRDWQLSGDDAFLRALWPQVKAALAYCWIPGGWDADQDGVMEGCQHNTLDVEYYGPNPLMGVWYLGALRAGEEMARALGEADFAATCASLFARGKQWLDEHLFNGDYYEQQVWPPAEGQFIAPGLKADMGAQDLRDPAFQVGPGCLVDQLVGQVLAHVCGLGYLLDPAHVRATLASIRRYNGRRDFYGHFNPMRSYVLNDEAALLMVSYPRGGRPAVPVPYFAEVMTGFEYAANVHMLYEGMTAEGLEGIAATRARYDGARRNPFDEAECGHHYARAMLAWGAVLAWSGFHYSGVTQRLTFASRVGTHFWSTGYAYGTAQVSEGDGERMVRLVVRRGTIALRRIVLRDLGSLALPQPRTLIAGEEAQFAVPAVTDPSKE